MSTQSGIHNWPPPKVVLHVKAIRSAPAQCMFWVTIDGAITSMGPVSDACAKADELQALLSKRYGVQAEIQRH